MKIYDPSLCSIFPERSQWGHSDCIAVLEGRKGLCLFGRAFTLSQSRAKGRKKSMWLKRLEKNPLSWTSGQYLLTPDSQIVASTITHFKKEVLREKTDSRSNVQRSLERLVTPEIKVVVKDTRLVSIGLDHEYGLLLQWIEEHQIFFFFFMNCISGQANNWLMSKGFSL